MISVIVAVRGEPPPAPEILLPLAEAGEVLVAATSDTPAETLDAFLFEGARVATADGPRGRRLREAAGMATGEVLLFLHADTRLPAGWARAVEGALASGAVAGAFRLGFSGGGARMRWVAFWANARTRWTRVPYGDQAPFVRKDVYERAGGHAEWPLLDDVDLGRRLRDAGPIAILEEPVLTSPRRYLERGVAKTVLLNWRILSRWRRGVSPEILAEEYRRK